MHRTDRTVPFHINWMCCGAGTFCTECSVGSADKISQDDELRTQFHFQPCQPHPIKNPQHCDARLPPALLHSVIMRLVAVLTVAVVWLAAAGFLGAAEGHAYLDVQRWNLSETCQKCDVASLRYYQVTRARDKYMSFISMCAPLVEAPAVAGRLGNGREVFFFFIFFILIEDMTSIHAIEIVWWVHVPYVLCQDPPPPFFLRNSHQLPHLLVLRNDALRWQALTSRHLDHGIKFNCTQLSSTESDAHGLCRVTAYEDRTLSGSVLSPLQT